MDLIQLIVLIVVVGVVIWLVQNFLPIDPRLKMLIIGLLIFAVIIWLLQSVGIFSGFRIGSKHGGLLFLNMYG